MQKLWENPGLFNYDIEYVSLEFMNTQELCMKNSNERWNELKDQYNEAVESLQNSKENKETLDNGREV